MATIIEMVNLSLIFTHFFLFCFWFYCVVFLVPSAPYLCFRGWLFLYSNTPASVLFAVPDVIFAQIFDARNFCFIKLVMFIQIIMRNFQIAKLLNQQMDCIHTLDYSKKNAVSWIISLGFSEVFFRVLGGFFCFIFTCDT